MFILIFLKKSQYLLWLEYYLAIDFYYFQQDWYFSLAILIKNLSSQQDSSVKLIIVTTNLDHSLRE